MPARGLYGRTLREVSERERQCIERDWRYGISAKRMEMDYRLSRGQIASLCKQLDLPKRRNRGSPRSKISRTTINVERSLVARVRVAAARRGLSYVQFVTNVLEEAIKAPPPPMKFPESPTVYQR